MNTDSFVIQIKSEDFYEYIANDVDTSNYDNNRLLPIGKIRLFKDELRRKFMIEFVRLRAKTYAYLMDDDTEQKKAKGKKMCNKKKTFVWKLYRLLI